MSKEKRDLNSKYILLIVSILVIGLIVGLILKDSITGGVISLRKPIIKEGGSSDSIECKCQTNSCTKEGTYCCAYHPDIYSCTVTCVTVGSRCPPI